MLLLLMKIQWPTNYSKLFKEVYRGNDWLISLKLLTVVKIRTHPLPAREGKHVSVCIAGQ